jgi:hypothetical protein
VWSNQPYNFDHLGMGLISLFVTVTLNGYKGKAGFVLDCRTAFVCVWGGGGCLQGPRQVSGVARALSRCLKCTAHKLMPQAVTASSLQ